MTRDEKSAAKDVAEALFDKVTESYCDTVGDSDPKIVDKILFGKDETFGNTFEAEVYRQLIKKLGGHNAPSPRN